MRRSTPLAAVAGATLFLGACGQAPTAENPEPAVIEEVSGTELSRITLTASAAERLDIQVAPVQQDGDRLRVPSSAVIIDTAGQYWVYTNPEPLVYVRAPLNDAWEEGADSFFEGGVDPGVGVVVVGVPELYGAEYGIGK